MSLLGTPLGHLGTPWEAWDTLGSLDRQDTGSLDRQDTGSLDTQDGGKPGHPGRREAWTHCCGSLDQR